MSHDDPPSSVVLPAPPPVVTLQPESACDAPLGQYSGLIGAAYMVSDEIFSRALLPAWIANGSPVDLVQPT